MLSNIDIHCHSHPFWDEACIAMGREPAAIAIAIVSAKPAEQFPLDPRRLFLLPGGEGQDRRTQSRPHHLGPAASYCPKTSS
jgi:hypothetical protein